VEATRNAQLNSSAFSIGRLIGNRDREEIAAQLIAAGMESGLPERECMRTVERGFSAGELSLQDTEAVALER
jgi:hypothetical protein